MSLPENVEKLLHAASIDWAAFYFRWETAKEIEECEIKSPIEQSFYICWKGLFHFGHFIGTKKIFTGDYKLKLIPQFKIEKYRADFRVEGTKYLIELDGHEWHEKTKEQARRDKERERLFIRKGFTVIRFTGQEVYDDAFTCAYETYIDILNSKLDKK